MSYDESIGCGPNVSSTIFSMGVIDLRNEDGDICRIDDKYLRAWGEIVSICHSDFFIGADERPSCMGRDSNVKQETPGQGGKDCRYLFTIILVYSCPTY